MKKAHKLVSAVLVSTMVLSMTACGSGEKTYKVGILQQLEHPALDQATQGFQDALTKLMGDSVTFDVQNAQGEQANCSRTTRPRSTLTTGPAPPEKIFPVPPILLR